MNRLVRMGTGYALVAAGTVMLVTPGPGLIAIAGGLALLAEDVAWAGRASDWVKAKIDRAQTEDGAEEPADTDQAGG